MKVFAVEFVGSVAASGNYPRLPHPEIAFAGRSNVGKSSLINCLLDRKMARISSTPGRTQQLNFFLVDGRLVFVDLPGYGYAKAPKSVRAAWGKLVEDYLVRARNLRGVVVILDIRRKVEEDDLMLLEFLSYYRRPALVVATKADKLVRSQRTRQTRAMSSALHRHAVIRFSARTGEGRDELWGALLEMAEGQEPERNNA